MTWFVYPETYIFFGILHHIALASLLLVFAGRLPMVILLALAIAVLALPHFEIGGLFNQNWLLWIGLADIVPQTYDFVPMAPWFAMGLIGAVLARIIVNNWEKVKLLALWRGDEGSFSGPIRLLVFLGRHSLAIYLLHQPILWSLAFLWANYVFPGGY